MTPQWITPLSLGKYTTGASMALQLRTNQPTTFQLLNGKLPSGIILSSTGMISGAFSPLLATTNFLFTVRAINSLNEISDRSFTIIVTPQLTLSFQNSGLIITSNDSTWINYQLPINNPTNESYEVWLLAGNLPNGVYVTKSGMIKGYADIPINPLTNTRESTTYEFQLAIDSNTGRDVKSFSIRINVAMSRSPVIINTTPPIDYETSEYSLYFNEGDFGIIKAGDDVALKIIGHDFNGSTLKYTFSNLPSGLTGDTNTGWVRGIINTSNTTYTRYKFTVFTYKADQPSDRSETKQFSFVLAKNMSGLITWANPTLNAFTGEHIAYKISATANTPLTYSIVAGSLPPNLKFNSIGEITGQISLQPNPVIPKNTSRDYSFTVKAASQIYPEITSTKVFTFKVTQPYSSPYDTVYFKISPSLEDRAILNSLLSNQTLIPDNILFRPYDKNYGKSKEVRINFMYGVNASEFDDYNTSVTTNHYYKTVYFGEVKTAKAKDDNGNVIYEVVYVDVLEDNETALDIVNGYPTNSFNNMSNQIIKHIGQNQTQYLLPRWMSSQQDNGSVLGPIKAWVICHTIPNASTQIKANIDTWKENFKMINFKIDRYYIDKSASFNWNSTSINPYWTSLPAGYPITISDERDFYVLFPKSNIKG